MSFCTVTTILGTAALGLLKGRFGSSVKIVKKNYPIFLSEEAAIFAHIYASIYESLGIYLDSIMFDNIQERNLLQNNNRLILFPIQNSKVLKSAGLYLGLAESEWNQMMMDQDNMEYTLTFEYAFEPINENVTEAEVKTEVKLFHDQIQLSIRKSLRHLLKSPSITEIYDEEGRAYSEIEDDEIIDDLTQENIYLKEIPLYVYEDNEGNQHRIPHRRPNEDTSKLRKR